MRLSDVPLSLIFAGIAVVALVALAVVQVRSRRRSAAEADSADSWERSEERRRRKEVVYGGLSYVLLFGCAAVAAALSFRGLVGFGRENLNLSGGWEYLVPFGLDGAAMFSSVLAVREASHGDAALGSRLLVWTFAAASAWFNWVHAPRGLGHAGAPQFFAGMSLSAAVLFDRALKQTRRAALREQGLVPRPLPQIRFVRWLRAPRETYSAWSLMLLEGVRTLDEAVEEVREDRLQKQQNRMRQREADKRERARMKALSQQHRAWLRGHGGRQVGVPELTPAPAGPAGADPARGATEAAVADTPAVAATPEIATRVRPALRSATEERPATLDLTAEDDTLTLPRFDSLERKLKDLERQFG